MCSADNGATGLSLGLWHW